MNHLDEEEGDAQLRDLLGDVAPPPGFIDVVVARRPVPLRRRLRPRQLAVGAAAGIAASIAASAAIALVGPSSAPVVPRGQSTSSDRATLVVPGAIVVAEPGAVATWSGPALRLERGQAFFRVGDEGDDDDDDDDDDDESFTVDTAFGSIVADRGCFTVHVAEDSPMSIASIARPRGSAAVAAAGMVVSGVVSAAVVHVFEGSVRIDDGHGIVVVDAGHDGVLAAPANAPTTSTKNSTAKPAARRPTSNPTPSSPDDAIALRAENERLRKLIATQDEELSLVANVLDDAEGGKPRAFPANLPQRLTADALKDAFGTGFAEAGIDGVITSIDCSEYPCMVWGEFTFDGSKLSETMNATPSFSAYQGDGKWVRSWGIDDHGREAFSITLAPPSEEVERDELFDKRVRHRNEEGEKRWRREHDEGGQR